MKKPCKFNNITIDFKCHTTGAHTTSAMPHRFFLMFFTNLKIRLYFFLVALKSINPFLFPPFPFFD